MRTYKELLEVLGEAEMAMISAEFWFSRDSTELLPKYINDKPDHPVWKELNTFQNGWIAAKNFYSINT